MRGGPYWVGLALLVLALRTILRISRHAGRFGHAALVVDVVLIGIVVVALVRSNRREDR
jgi:hypothetical protein